MEFPLRNKEQYVEYAAKNYTCACFKTQKEFVTDLNRVVYIKKLLNRFISGEDVDLLLLVNHLIILFNVFKKEAIITILFHKIDESNWKLLNTALYFLDIREENVIYLKMNTRDLGIIESIMDQLKHATNNR
jgi:hypothetical protein